MICELAWGRQKKKNEAQEEKKIRHRDDDNDEKKQHLDHLFHIITFGVKIFSYYYS